VRPTSLNCGVLLLQDWCLLDVRRAVSKAAGMPGCQPWCCGPACLLKEPCTKQQQLTPRLCPLSPCSYVPALLPFLCTAAATLFAFRHSIPADKCWRDPFVASATKCKSACMCAWAGSQATGCTCSHPCWLLVASCSPHINTTPHIGLMRAQMPPGSACRRGSCHRGSPRFGRAVL